MKSQLSIICFMFSFLLADIFFWKIANGNDILNWFEAIYLVFIFGFAFMGYMFWSIEDKLKSEDKKQ